MIVAGLAVAVFVLFLARVAHEPRSFGNAVLLGLALALGGLALAETLARSRHGPEHLMFFALVAVVALEHGTVRRGRKYPTGNDAKHKGVTTPC